MIFAFALAQAVTSVPPPTIDLVKDACASPSSSDADVIVCGRRRDDESRYRIDPALTAPFERAKAEHSFSNGVVAAAETENVDIGGRPSNRVMLRLKIKF